MYAYIINEIIFSTEITNVSACIQTEDDLTNKCDVIIIIIIKIIMPVDSV